MSTPTYEDLIAFAAAQPCSKYWLREDCGRCTPCLARAYKARPSPADKFQGKTYTAEEMVTKAEKMLRKIDDVAKTNPRLVEFIMAAWPFLQLEHTVSGSPPASAGAVPKPTPGDGGESQSRPSTIGESEALLQGDA